MGMRNGASTMRDGQLQRRTRQFAIETIRLVQSLPVSRPAEILGRQLLRAATSVGANYRAACRARSRADFINKLGMVEEEADECLYWLELLTEAKVVSVDVVGQLRGEADAITAMVVASIKRVKGAKTG